VTTIFDHFACLGVHGQNGQFKVDHDHNHGHRSNISEVKTVIQNLTETISTISHLKKLIVEIC
jgi:hypothetical protein